MNLRVCRLGPTRYADGLALQQSLVAARAAEATGDWLLYPDHPPVLTVGRSASPDSMRVDPETLRRMGIDVFEVARGGDVTWHGPGQLVGYLITHLDAHGRDLHRFLRRIEQGLIRTLRVLEIEGERHPGRTGVWVGGQKIASIGVAVRRWVSYHGFALNVAPDLRFFDLIHPCGLHGIRMTSVAERLGDRAPALADVQRLAAEAMAAELGYFGWSWATPAEASQAAAAASAATAPVASG